MTKFYEKFEKRRKPLKELEPEPKREHTRKPFAKKAPISIADKYPDGHNFPMRLNKFVAHCGVCSRRAAIDLIKEGKVVINGAVASEPGVEVLETDIVTIDKKVIKPVQKLIYVLMNKPKNVITTLSDEKARATVMDILSKKIKERIYPVGRLDRDTTGLLLLTNDGDLAQKLSHPRNKIRKIYHVTIDRQIEERDLAAIQKGIELEDGMIKPDKVYIIEKSEGLELGIEIHEGRNRIVRRIFEYFGYKIIRLDRVFYAGLTKKDLQRGWFRHLTNEEVVFLKHYQ